MKFQKTIKEILILLLSTSGFLLPSLSYADYAIIVNPNNNVELSKKQIQRIFLGKMKSFPGGGSIIPLDVPPGEPIRDLFNQEIIKKSNQQVTSYWGRLIFTGKGLPPKVLANTTEIKKLISINPSTIGYIVDTEVDDSVKVIMKF